MSTEALMKRLFWRFWYASRDRFLYPGLYYCHQGNRRIIPWPQAKEEIALVEFPEQTVVIAKEQPEYRPLPAYRFQTDPEGKIVCCWQLSLLGRLRLLFTGKIWHRILTFNGPLQPQLLEIKKPFMPPHWPRK